MVKANDSWLFPQQHSAWQLPCLNHMSMLLEHRQQECLPSSTDQGTGPFSGHRAVPGSTVSDIQSLEAKQTNECHGLLQYFPPHLQTLFPPPNSSLNEKQSEFSCGFCGRLGVPNANPGTSQKGFFIFDQSGNETRLIYNSDRPPSRDRPIASAKLVYGNGSDEVRQTTIMNQIGSTKYLLHEETGDNHRIEESEMHDDTEEINALLYSDDDDDDDDCDEDDEAKSTGHSPIGFEENYRKKRVEELAEMFSFDAPNKRHKLPNGDYMQFSPMETVVDSVKLDGSLEYESDAESSYAFGQTEREEINSTLVKMKSKRDKIRETIRVLEIVIPGTKGKDPVLIIDEAIDYLKSIKLKAETLGVSFFH